VQKVEGLILMRMVSATVFVKLGILDKIAKSFFLALLVRTASHV